MKSIFPGYYQPSEQDFKDLWENAIFIFDTNSLLNLFRYPKDSREMLFSVLKKIEKRIWIPYQVAVEYHNLLNEEITSQKQAYDKMKSTIDSDINAIVENLNDQRHANINFDEIINKLEDVSKFAGQNLDDQKKSHPDLEGIKIGLSEIIGDKIGREYSQEDLDNIYSEGDERYLKKIPPGFKDAKQKGERTSYHNNKVFKDKYGDLVYWKQILEKSKEESVKAVILITDDTKEDWWYKVKGETKGAHPQLAQEFYHESTGKNFYMYKTEQFLVYAKQHFSMNENIEKVVKEIENTKILEMNNQLIEEAKNVLKSSPLSRISDALRSEGVKPKSVVYCATIQYEVNDDDVAEFIKNGTLIFKMLYKMTTSQEIEIQDTFYDKGELKLYFRTNEMIIPKPLIVERINAMIEETFSYNFKVVRIHEAFNQELLHYLESL